MRLTVMVVVVVVVVVVLDVLGPGRSAGGRDAETNKSARKRKLVCRTFCIRGDFTGRGDSYVGVKA